MALFVQQTSSQIFDMAIPEPIGYPKGSVQLIISTNSAASNGGIFMYNLESNQSRLLSKYPKMYQLNDHAQFIDYANDILYIFGGPLQTFSTFNFKTEEWRLGSESINYHYQLSQLPDCTRCVYVNTSIKDQIHIISNRKHIIFDCNEQKFMDIEREIQDGYFKPIFVPFKNQLMLLGGDRTDDIYTCAIDQDKYEWKLHDKLKMPHRVKDDICYDCLLFDDIVFIFHIDAFDVKDSQKYSDIWYLDLLDEHWYRSKYDVPHGLGFDVRFIQNKNNVHFLNFVNGKQVIVNIHDLFTTNFVKCRRDRYSILVMGYFRRQESNDLPSALKQIVLNYFPIIQN